MSWYAVTWNSDTIAIFADEDTAKDFTQHANTYSGSGNDYQCARVATYDDCPCCGISVPEDRSD